MLLDIMFMQRIYGIQTIFSGSPVRVTLMLPQQQLPVTVDIMDGSSSGVYVCKTYTGRFIRVDI